MLYVSTRSKTDSYTAYRALHEEKAPDGGLYIPMRIPRPDQEFFLRVRSTSFGNTVSEILNLFFSVHLSVFDIDYLIGKSPCRIFSMNRRILIGELWHNIQDSFDYIYESLSAKLSGTKMLYSGWLPNAIRIAFLFGLWGEARKIGSDALDLCLPADDFSWPFAAFYARQMGLPIGQIICCLPDNSSLWGMIQQGEWFAQKNCPADLERFLFTALGFHEALRYRECTQKRSLFAISKLDFQESFTRMSAVVTGANRIETVIASVCQTNGCRLDSFAALSYSGLQDYRADKGLCRDTMILELENPARAVH